MTADATRALQFTVLAISSLGLIISLVMYLLSQRYRTATLWMMALFGVLFAAAVVGIYSQ